MSDPVSIDFLKRRIAELQSQQPTEAALKEGGGGGTFDGMEARLAKLESDVTHVQSDVSNLRADIRELRGELRVDFRLLFGAIIAVALGLAGLMAKGFKWL